MRSSEFKSVEKQTKRSDDDCIIGSGAFTRIEQLLRTRAIEITAVCSKLFASLFKRLVFKLLFVWSFFTSGLFNLKCLHLILFTIFFCFFVFCCLFLYTNEWHSNPLVILSFSFILFRTIKSTDQDPTFLGKNWLYKSRSEQSNKGQLGDTRAQKPKIKRILQKKKKKILVEK